MKRTRRVGNAGQTVIYGNGAMANVLYSYVRHRMHICGFTVDDACMADGPGVFCGLPLVPFSRVQETFDPATCKMIIAMGFLEMNELRERKYLEARQKGYSFVSFVHESVMIHDAVAIEDNCVVLDHVSIQPGCHIGRGTFISSNVNIGHDCTIGSFGWICSGVSIAGGCQLGPGCFLGINASVGHAVRVGARNFIAANTLVNKHTKDNEVYVSRPGLLFRLNSKSFLKFRHVLD